MTCTSSGSPIKLEVFLARRRRWRSRRPRRGRGGGWAGRRGGRGARGGASLDWLVELEREEDWAREDKYDAAAFGVFMGSTGFSRFQGGLGEWGEWDEMYPQLGMDFDDDD